MTCRLCTAAGVAYAALAEVGRIDLADIACWFEDNDGTLYIELADELADPDLRTLLRAEAMALEFVDRTSPPANCYRPDGSPSCEAQP